MSVQLTPAQERVLRMIKTLIQDKGYPPTITELMHAMGFTSPNTIQCHLEVLERKQAIARDKRVARGIRVTGKPVTANG
jgi:repressor LexA